LLVADCEAQLTPLVGPKYITLRGTPW